jgi:lipopolysaccharide/colanic/teichoic acid biosynthesis glycosyltransferase
MERRPEVHREITSKMAVGALDVGLPAAARRVSSILSGDMSLIGPRLAAPGEVLLDDSAWQRVLAIRPGISGLEQVTYGFAKVDPQCRLELNLRYIRERSLALDLRLLLRTCTTLLRRPPIDTV